MASTGNVFPTVGANVDRAGNTAWTNPGNVVSDNATDATVVVPSDYLVTSGYGFTTIPTNATINGVTVRVEASETGSGTSDYIPQLHSDTTPTLIGSPKSAVAVSGTAKVISTTGSASDLWGATITPATVHASGFGVSIWSTDTTNTLAVDFITIAIDYTVPGPGIATESSTALALTVTKIRAVGVASEADTSLALPRTVSRPTGLGAEADSAVAAAVTQIRAPGVSSESDASLALAIGELRAVGMATETDTSVAVTVIRVLPTGLATEANTASADCYAPHEFTAGPNFPSTGQTVSNGGGEWTNPGNVVSDNGADATSAEPTDYLVSSGYGFTTIPTNAVILGVTATDESSETGPGSVIFYYQLHSDTTPTLIGAVQSVTIAGATKVVHICGGPSDLWGATITAPMVHATGFGLTGHSDDQVDANGIAIDYLTLAIRYRVPSPGVSTETDTALAPVVGHAGIPVGMATETDTPLALGRTKIRAVGMATEADSALAPLVENKPGIGRAVETDSAQALVARKLVGTGTAAEAGQSLALRAVKFRPITISAETDEAFKVLKIYPVLDGAETDAALPRGFIKFRPIGMASEPDAGVAPRVSRNYLAGVATESDSASTLIYLRGVHAGRSNEADAAITMGLIGGIHPHNNMPPYFTAYIWVRAS